MMQRLIENAEQKRTTTDQVEGGKVQNTNTACCHVLTS